jgi:glucokinase
MTATRLVADIGGTNTRIALFNAATGDLQSVSNYINREFDHLEEVIQHWLENLPGPAPVEACIAVAAPPTADRVEMINMNWSFSGREIAARYGLERFRLINDFEANAYSLPYLASTDSTVIHEGVNDGRGILATVGPGTGLGGATVQRSGGQFIARAAEPGHMGLSPVTEIEQELFKYLLPKFGNVYAELLVSGPGLQRLYQTLADIKGLAVDPCSAAEISNRAITASDPLCVEALNILSSLLGSVCGDFVLANGAYSGLYLAGGIVPQMIPFLENSQFHSRFVEKGAMVDNLQGVPVHVITTANPGLIGAANAPI